MKKKIMLTISILILIVIYMTGCLGSRHNYYTKVPTTPKDFGFEFGYGTNNNGYDKESEYVDRLISVVPNQKQLDYLELEYYNFIHFGTNTMTDAEWGTGKESPSLFNPTKLDTDQWCEAVKASGSKGIVLTAKHHDGFCLWPTEYTEHSIKNSPYKNGNGDIVKELSESCQKYGLKLGLYLSPWDMNASTYGTNAYNDFFVNQLTELATNYGDIFMFWFDGARGDNVTLDEDFEYDFTRYYEVIKELQPNAVTAVQGEDVRWVGNEAGVSRESEWSVVVGDKKQKFQQNAQDGKALKEVSYDSEDIGSREVLSNYKNLIFKPAEVDVSIRNGWFFHNKEKPKKLEHLLKIYFKAVGGNSSLLLNLPPNKDGLIDQKDVVALQQLGDAIASYSQGQINESSITASVGTHNSMNKDNDLSLLLNDERYQSYELKDNNYILDFDFDTAKNIDRIDIREDLRYSQRVELFEVWAKNGEKWTRINASTVIGNRKIILFQKSIKAEKIRIVIKQSRSNPHIRNVSFYDFSSAQ